MESLGTAIVAALLGLITGWGAVHFSKRPGVRKFTPLLLGLSGLLFLIAAVAFLLALVQVAIVLGAIAAVVVIVVFLYHKITD